IIVGREGWASLAHDDRRDIPHTVFRLKTHPEKYDRLIWIGNADDRKLEQAYAQADCLIAASYDEGFGLPIIEAAQRGIPVIARDIPVFHEVAPAGTTFFSPNELANTIIWWRKPDKTTLSPFQHTWHDSAVEVLDWLNSAVALDGKH
ncbi:MAG TPA: glycosyltransferase, partial [Orrella sp.]